MECLKSMNGSWESAAIALSRECTLSLFVNGKQTAELSCSPWSPEELTLGYLRTERLIRTREELLSLRIVSEESGCVLRADAEIAAPSRAEPIRRDALSWDTEQLLRLWEYVIRDAEKTRSGHGLHSMTLMREGELLCFREDIGRHNAIDRAVGWAMQHDTEPADCIAFFSGRISLASVRKFDASGLRVIASKALPTQEAAALAKERGITLLCVSNRDGILRF